MTNEMQAAIVGAAATLVAGVIAALIVVWQIGVQFKLAIAQNKLFEGLKLKLEVYREIAAACDSALKTQGEMSQFINELDLALKSIVQYPNLGIDSPKHRAVNGLLAWQRMSDGALSVRHAILRWRSVHPDLIEQQTKVAEAINSADDAFRVYAEYLVEVTPKDTGDKTVPWTLPNANILEALQQSSEVLLEAIAQCGLRVVNVQRTAHSALVAPLFS